LRYTFGDVSYGLFAFRFDLFTSETFLPPLTHLWHITSLLG
jgi:hypothetical protein